MSLLGLVAMFVIMIFILSVITFALFRAKFTKKEFFFTINFVMFLGLALGDALNIHYLWWTLATVVVFLIMAVLGTKKFIRSIPGVGK